MSNLGLTYLRSKMKPPAINFYTQDFLVGTTFMTDEEVGQYIRLLCYQHQMNGYLPDKIFERLCHSDAVREKFQHCERGWYNERMLEEIQKRIEYTESRRANRFKGLQEKSEKKDTSRTKKEKKERIRYIDGRIEIPDSVLKEITAIFSEGLLKQELPKMEKWLQVNKPKKDYNRFVFNWLNNCNGIITTKRKKEKCEYCGEYVDNLYKHYDSCQKMPPPASPEKVAEIIGQLTNQFTLRRNNHV